MGVEGEMSPLPEFTHEFSWRGRRRCERFAIAYLAPKSLRDKL
jgi:hypothetical protein